MNIALVALVGSQVPIMLILGGLVVLVVVVVAVLVMRANVRKRPQSADGAQPPADSDGSRS